MTKPKVKGKPLTPSELARATPSLKMQTPLEKEKTNLRRMNDKTRWEWLFSPERNRWKPIV